MKLDRHITAEVNGNLKAISGGVGSADRRESLKSAYEAFATACMLSNGPDPVRAAYWEEKAKDRLHELRCKMAALPVVTESHHELTT